MPPLISAVLGSPEKEGSGFPPHLYVCMRCPVPGVGPYAYVVLAGTYYLQESGASGARFNIDSLYVNPVPIKSIMPLMRGV